MRPIVFAASTLAATLLWLPSQAAQPDSGPVPQPTAAKAAEQTISFAEYRDWRNNFIAERRTQLEARLAAPDLNSTQRARLEQQKGYYDWFAGLSETERDRRFRERFDQIDANHDGIIDPAERAAWHEKQRAFYDRGGNRQQTAARQTQ